MSGGDRPALKEPLLWLVIALPLAAVIAGIATLAIAVRAGGSEAVPDPVRRTAQVQQLDLAPDHIARNEGISARLVLEADGQLQVGVVPDQSADVLLLQLIHPTDAEQDRQVALTRHDATWRAVLPVTDLSHDWRLQLAPADGRWRLHGRWTKASKAVELTPALGHE